MTEETLETDLAEDAEEEEDEEDAWSDSLPCGCCSCCGCYCPTECEVCGESYSWLHEGHLHEHDETEETE